MKTAIDYTEDDFLTLQLFVASRSALVKRNRRKNVIILAAASFVCAIGFYIGDNKFFMYYCLVVGFLFLFIYPLYQRGLYRRHYRKFVKDKFKNLTDLNYQVEINKGEISATSKLGDSVIKSSQLQEIVETGQYFFLTMSTGDTIALPKRCFDYDILSAQLADIAKSNNFSIIKELNWKWN